MAKKLNLFIMLLAVVAFAACQSSGSESANSDAKTTAKEAQKKEKIKKPAIEVIKASSTIEARSGSSLIGKAIFREANGRVSIVASVANVTPGQHAMHIHAVGDCSGADGKTAGGHWNPDGHDHGKWGEKEHFHRGDIGNIEVGEDGKGRITLTTDLWCLGCDDEKKNVIGKSLIIHAKADDFESQPSGAAGARIGCGVIAMEK